MLNQIQKLFSNIDNQSRIAFGPEPEFMSRSFGRNAYNRLNSLNTSIAGLKHKPDGSNADCEQDLPALADCNVAWDYLKDCLDFANNNGSYCNKDCSVHVHFSTMPIRSDLTNEQFTRKSIQMKHQYNSSNYNHYLEDPAIVAQLFDVRESMQIPLEVIKDIGYRMSKHIDFYGSLIARSRRDGYFCRYPASAETVKRANCTVEDLRRALNPSGSSYKYSALNINKYHSTKTIENRSHSSTLEYKKIKTWFKFNSNLILNSLVSRFKARTELQEITSPSYIGRSANTLKSQVWDYCRGNVRSTRDIMSHVGINNPQSVRRTMSEIRSIDHYKPFIVTHNQQEFNVDYGRSLDHGDNGYEVLISKNIEIVTDNLDFISDNNNRGSSSLTAGLDNQTLADLNERIRQLA
jgi:hypothetical protein